VVGGETQKAIACFEQELELAPDRARAYYNLGLSWRIDGQYERAIDAYRRAIELEPTYADIYNNLGNIYLLQERYHEAIELYQQALRYHPSDALFHYNLGACYELVGEQNKAKAELARVRKLDPTLEQRIRRAAFDESARGRERFLPIIEGLR
jgi:tetratricopeptide (TPR) repeat protein